MISEDEYKGIERGRDKAPFLPWAIALGIFLFLLGYFK